MACLSSDDFFVVVCPNVSLIQDTTYRCNKLGIPTAELYFGKTADYRERLKFDIFKKQVRILVITPDRMDKENTMTLLRVVRANNQRICVVIDEVHTIIEDCHFRPCFNKIALIKKNIPDTYHLAISATINDASCLLIQQKLDIPNAVKVLSPYVHRVNIEYKTVLRKSSLTSAVYAQIKDGLSSSRGIIYASSQKHVNDITEALKKHSVCCESYHSGLPSDEKSTTLRGFVSGSIQIVVATNALGMGIDIPDLRFIIHAELPKSSSSLLQETGRCGRDNQKATSIILYSKRDVSYNTFITGKKAESYQVYNAAIRTGVCLRVNFNSYLVDIKSEDMVRDNSCATISSRNLCGHCQHLALANKAKIIYDVGPEINKIQNIIIRGVLMHLGFVGFWVSWVFGFWVFEFFNPQTHFKNDWSYGRLGLGFRQSEF